MKTLVVGTVAFDAIETPYLKTEKTVGGAATYICLSASTNTQNLKLVSVVGGDFPTTTIKMLKEKNICLEGLQIKKGEKTFFWSGKYHQNMNHRDTLDTQLNVIENFNPVLPDSYKDSDIVMLGNLIPTVQKKVINQMTKKPKLIVLDTMNFWMDNFMTELKEVLKDVDVITINDEEAQQLSGNNDLIEAAKKIKEMGPKYIIIKRGAEGAVLIHKEKQFCVPAIKLQKVVDPTGAGDTFAGGFIGFLQKNKELSFENMKKAVIHATVMASFCVEELGIKGVQNIDEKRVIKRTRQLEKTVDSVFV